jgi:hypothetical protein
VSIVPVSAGVYQIKGLAGLQTQAGRYVLTVDATKITNPAGVTGTGTYAVDWFLDQNVPLASLSTTASAPVRSTPIPVTVILNKPVSGFGPGGVQLGNAVLSNFRGSGRIYTFDLTPRALGVQVTAQVAAGSARDAAGNANPASAPFSLPLAIVGPTATVTSQTGPVTNQPQVPISVQFASPVSTTAAALLDAHLVTGGKLAVAEPSNGGSTSSYYLTPTGSGPVTATVQVPAGVAKDLAGNGNLAAAPFSVTFDATPPTVLLTSADSPGTFQSPIPVTARFSKPVTGIKPVTGSKPASLSVTNAKVVDFAGNGDTYTFGLVPTSSGPVTAQVLAGAGTDAAGNSSTASAIFSRVYEVAPVATLFSTAGPNTNSQDLPIYVQFNVPVRLDASAISVAQGQIVGSVTQISPTAFLFHVKGIPTKNQTGATVTVTVPQLSATDAFGNTNQSPATYSFF